MDNAPYPFVRFPNALLHGLMTGPFTTAQLRVALWVVRNTVGWNERLSGFTWYRIAKELHLDRAGAWRAGRALVLAGVLYLEKGRLGIENDPNRWRMPPRIGSRRRQTLTEVNADARQRNALIVDNLHVDPGQRDRCVEATDMRRAKDSCKDTSKTYKDKWPTAKRRPASISSGAARRDRRKLADRPRGGKYDGLSEN